LTGYFKFAVDWKEQFKGAVVTGYPGAILGGKVIEAAYGDLVPLSPALNIVSIKHGQIKFTQGSSGGVWVANFSGQQNDTTNIAISLTSFGSQSSPGLSFGPYFTSDFKRLLEYTSKGCPK